MEENVPRLGDTDFDSRLETALDMMDNVNIALYDLRNQLTELRLDLVRRYRRRTAKKG